MAPTSRFQGTSASRHGKYRFVRVAQTIPWTPESFFVCSFLVMADMHKQHPKAI